MKKNLSLLIIFFWVATGAGRAQSIKPVRIKAEAEWSLNTNAYLFTTSKQLTPVQAFATVRTTRMTAINRSHINLGIQTEYVWLYFRLKNDGLSKTVLFTFDRIDIHQVQCFRQRNGHIDTLAITGDALSFYHRPVKVNYFAIPIPLIEQDQSDVIVLLEKRNEFISGNIGLYSADRFLQKVRFETAIVALFLGVAGFIFIFNFLLWLSLSDSVHLLFMAHLSSIVLYVLSSLGYSFEFFWPDLTYSNSLVMTMLSGMWASTNLFLIKRFLNLTPKTSQFSKAATGLAWYIFLISFIGCSIALFQPQDLPSSVIKIGEFLLVTWIAANAILLVAIFTEQIRKRNPAAYLYVAALSFTLFGTVIYSFTLLNVVNAGAYTTNWLLPGFLLEETVLAFGLTMRYNRFRQQNFKLELSLAEERNEVNITILNAQETERRRIAQDLHDDIGTSLITLRGKLPTTSSDAHHLLDQIITDVRAVSHNLMPDELATLGLSGALSEAARRLQESSSVRFLFVCAGDIVSLSQVAELALYRAVLELMHNVVRHSRATEAVVQLVYHPDLLNVTVEDNGQGFSGSKISSSSGIGLKNVASRTEWLGGKIAIDSSAIGTTIRLDIPYGIHTS